MLGKSNETVPQVRDSFYDDDDDENATVPAPHLISSIRIVTSKPPVCRQRSQSSSPSPSSCYSDHDVTDVSSLGGENLQSQHQQNHHRKYQKKQQKYEDNQQQLNHDQQHSFHFESMKHVLLGASDPVSRPPTPVQSQSQQQLHKKQVRIVTDETENSLRRHSQNHHHHHHQPYIHGHSRDYRRVRLTSSAINRQKQQQKIERDNLRILERLQRTHATQSLKRDELLSHYDRQMGYVSYPGPPLPPKLHYPSRPSSAAMMSSTFSTSGKRSDNQSRPSSASHAMNSNSGGRSRPGSASNSVRGSSRSSSARRPVWNDRWQQHE